MWVGITMGVEVIRVFFFIFVFYYLMCDLHDIFNLRPIRSRSIVRFFDHGSAEIFLALLPEEEEEGHAIGDHTELDTAVARYDNLPEYIDGELVAVVALMLQRLNGACITFDEFSTLLDRELEDITNGPIMSILVHNKGRAVGLETTKKQLEQKGTECWWVLVGVGGCWWVRTW